MRRVAETLAAIERMKELSWSLAVGFVIVCLVCWAISSLALRSLMSRRSKILRIVVTTAGTFALVLTVLYFLGASAGKQQLRISRIELINVFRVWTGDGRPEGNLLLEFMRNFPPDRVTLSNRSIVVGGSNFVTIFATSRLQSGTLFITTNGVLLLEREPGLAEISH